ncbi:MAG: OmpA family protein [Bacteroidota bacterium]
MPPLAPHLIQQIKDRVAKGDTRRALDQLLGMLQVLDDQAEAYEESLVLSGELSQHEDAVRKGMADDSKLNALSFRLLKILDKLDPKQQQANQSRIQDIVSGLRAEMFKANMQSSDRDIKRLGMKIAGLVSLYPESFELVELQEQVQRSIESRTAALGNKPEPKRVRIAWAMSILLLVVSAATLFYYMNEATPASDNLLAVIREDGVELAGIEPFMEEPECQRLIALADKINGEKDYYEELYEATNGQQMTNRIIDELSGDYDALYNGLRKERGQLLQNIRAMEDRLIDSIEYKDILFDSSSYELKTDHQKTLHQVALLLKKKNHWKIDLSGHTDDVGSDQSNNELSRNRAEAVKTYLIEQGVLPEQIQTFSHGESQPRLPNTSDSSRAVNRRTELSIQRPQN